MPGIGTVVNVAAIVAGGIAGSLLGGRFSEAMQRALMRATGVCVLFIGGAGALAGMLAIDGEALVSGRSLLVVASIALGTLVGELLGIDAAIERFGTWLKAKTGNADDAGFVGAFVTASVTVCVGAMAVVGSIQDGMLRDPSTLFTKALLDAIIIAVMSCSMGRGCAFSAIPVAIFQGAVTALAVLVGPYLTDAATANLSLVGGILIFCVGVNLVWDPRITVANMLPAVLIAPLLAYLPVGL